MNRSFYWYTNSVCEVCCWTK